MAPTPAVVLAATTMKSRRVAFGAGPAAFRVLEAAAWEAVFFLEVGFLVLFEAELVLVMRSIVLAILSGQKKLLSYYNLFSNLSSTYPHDLFFFFAGVMRRPHLPYFCTECPVEKEH
jgi:hypothetical protein